MVFILWWCLSQAAVRRPITLFPLSKMAEGQEVLAPQYGDELLGGHGGLDNGDGHRAEAYGNYENREGDAGAGGEKSAEESTEGKVFVGGVSWQTTEDGLRYYFGKYGEISDVLLMKDKNTGAPRGFGFVVFKNPAGKPFPL